MNAGQLPAARLASLERLGQGVDQSSAEPLTAPHGRLVPPVRKGSMEIGPRTPTGLPDLLPLPFSDPPDLLGWEAFGPFGGYRAVNAGRGLGCSDLDAVDDVEADVVEQSNPRRDRQVELDAARLVNGVAPVQSPQIKVGASPNVRSPVQRTVRSVSTPSPADGCRGTRARRRDEAAGAPRRSSAIGSHQIAAPYSLIAKSNEPSGWATVSALPCTHSMSSSPWRSLRRRAVANWASELSMAYTDAPRRRIHADT